MHRKLSVKAKKTVYEISYLIRRTSTFRKYCPSKQNRRADRSRRDLSS